MSGVVAMLLVVLAILTVLTVRQLLAMRVNVRRHGGLHEGWAALQAQNADDLNLALLRVHAWQASKRQPEEPRGEQVIAPSRA
jgi:hypothetical protein